MWLIYWLFLINQMTLGFNAKNAKCYIPAEEGNNLCFIFGDLLRYKSSLVPVQQPRKRFCCSDICVFEMIALIPFKSTVYMTIVQVTMNRPDRVSYLCHHRIARFLLFVAETQIYCFRLYPILKDVVLEIWKPY